jgi:DNA-binding NarL/FixJ family response regulator
MTTPARILRVIIAEDLALLRDGMAALLTDAGHEVVATVGDGPSLEAAVREHRPDLAIVDVRMPPNQRDEGVRAALAIRREVPGIAVLIVSQYVEHRYATELLAAGTESLGYLLKDRVADASEFLAAVERVAGGGTAIDEEVVAQLLSGHRSAEALATLSDREREVLSLMAEGYGNAAIGERLGIGQGAVEKHVRNVFTKLGLPQAGDRHRRVLAVLTYLGV